MLTSPLQVVARRKDTAFYLGASVAIVVVVFIGFARTYYLRAYFYRAQLPALAHIHGLLFSSWILLFFAQTCLIAIRQTQIQTASPWGLMLTHITTAGPNGDR